MRVGLAQCRKAVGKFCVYDAVHAINPQQITAEYLITCGVSAVDQCRKKLCTCAIFWVGMNEQHLLRICA